MDPEALFAGHPLGSAAYRRVAGILDELGGADVTVTRTQLAFRRRRGIAYLWLPGMWLRHPAADVVLSIALPREAPSPRWKQVAHPAPRVWMHHLELHDVADLDEEVAGWLEEAWRAAG